ncbi:hypothetical protein GALMADRAFT_249032 [Galerina marginata CBS 339.88]|uniref:Uncharacterized protein n=1 Tax=Galerina marginata (strain CBS 339.88) TaxID=685588 RepID=A0A067T5C0_GALM3|nr:hypothetical protein GALMADRAFT_249032 [Galerina marginata CBS 339.88]
MLQPALGPGFGVSTYLSSHTSMMNGEHMCLANMFYLLGIGGYAGSSQFVLPK